MAILPDFSQYYGQGGGLLGDLPQWLTEQGNTSVAPPRVNQTFAGVPDWFSAIKSGFDNNQGVVVPPGRFPTLSSGQRGDAELPPNPPPAMQPPPSADGYYGGSPETNPLLNPARYGNYPAPKPAPAPTFGSVAGEVGNRLLGAMNGFA